MYKTKSLNQTQNTLTPEESHIYNGHSQSLLTPEESHPYNHSRSQPPLTPEESHIYTYTYLLYLLAFFLFLFLGFQQNTQAQIQKKNISTVIILNSGAVVNGDYIIRAKQDSICLKMYDGSELNFHFNEIKEIKSKMVDKKKKLKGDFFVKKRGYYNVSQLGFLIGSTTWNPVTFTMHSINGYQLFPQLAAGIGLGFDNYESNIFTPIYLDLRGDLFSKTHTTPFYYGGLGYGIWVNGNDNQFNTNDGGLFYNFGIGIRRRSLGQNNWVLSVGQQTQQAIRIFENPGNGWNTGPSRTETRLFFNRLVIKTGVSF